MKKIFSTKSGLSKNGSVGFEIQKCKSNLIATYGNEQQVCIYNRHGKLKSDVSLTGHILDMDWDKDGDNLAIICEKSTSVHVWDSKNTKITQIGTNFKETLSCLAWSKVDFRMAIGTTKGNLLIYDTVANKKYPILGKHTKKVSLAVWSLTSLLATAGEDKVLTLNSMEGDLIKQIQLSNSLSDLKFAHSSLSKCGANEDNSLSFISGLQAVLIWKFHEDSEPLNLPLDDSCDSVITHEWLDNGGIIVGFTSGIVVVVSTNEVDFGQELFRIRDHKDNLLSLSISKRLNRLATASSKSIKIHDLSNLNELLAIIELEDDDSMFTGAKQSTETLLVSEGSAAGVVTCAINWSDDGQLLTAVSPRHILHVFLSQLPMLADVSLNGLVVRLTSLLEVTIEPLCPDVVLEGYAEPRSLLVKVEPTFISIGLNHLAVGLNNRVWFYDHSNPDSISLIEERDYAHIVHRIKLNAEYSAVATADGHVTLHWIDPKKFPLKMQEMAASGCLNLSTSITGSSLADKLVPFATRQQKNFPEKPQGAHQISSFQLTERYFIYNTEAGNLVQFCLEDWMNVSEYAHTSSIVSVSCNKFGNFIAFIDEHKLAYIYNPLSGVVVQFPNFPPSAYHIFWNLDDDENPILIALDTERLTTYKFFTNCIPSVASKTKSEEAKPHSRLVRSGSVSEFPVEKNSTNEPLYSNLLLLPISGAKTSKQLTSTFGECRLIGVTRLPQHHVPLGIYNENMCFLSQTGRLVSAPLSTHDFKAYTKQIFSDKLNVRVNGSHSDGKTLKSTDTATVSFTRGGKRDKLTKELINLSENEIVGLFDHALLVGEFGDALMLSDFLQSRSRWHQLGLACVKNLDFELAIQAFQRLENCGLVLAVQRMTEIEEKQLLYGYISMFLGDYDRAQDFFLASSRPVAALDMRRDLLHWDAALQLARSLLPSEMPFISREYAFELECVGDYVNALMNFESALERHSPTRESTMLGAGDEECDAIVELACKSKVVDELEEKSWAEHENLCNAGIARNSIHLGDYKRGVSMVLKHPSKSLKKECALILEQSRQWNEAAMLYEAAGQIDSAIIVCLKCKNFDKAGELLRETKASPKMYLDYAKAREAMGNYKEAAIAYESAGDWNSVVRLLLEKLNNPTDAVRVVNESQSVDGAKIVAEYFIKIGDFASAIQFLVLSRCHSTAFELAQKHRKMDVYADVIGIDATANEYKSVAAYYECEKNWLMAGKFYFYAKQYGKAIRHLLRVPYADNSPALDLAIEAVGEANDPKLTHMVIIYLMGETDGMAKDARHLFRLYMALQKYREAARTAVIIAREEQMAGNYRNAHDLLFSMVQELRQRKIKVPSEMLDNLALLHSYTLAKLHIKAGNHITAAQLLIRVAQNISKFPSHIVSILTSTVIECQKVGLSTSSFTYASVLLRPEYRDKIDPKYRRKFEGLVRRPEKPTEEEMKILGASSPCFYCSTELQNYELNCASCRTNLNYCALTGKHIIKSDVTLCPNCDFPMTYSDLMKFLENAPNLPCPMCASPLSRETTRRLVDALDVISSWNSESIEQQQQQQEMAVSNDPTEISLSTMN